MWKAMSAAIGWSPTGLRLAYGPEFIPSIMYCNKQIRQLKFYFILNIIATNAQAQNIRSIHKSCFPNFMFSKALNISMTFIVREWTLLSLSNVTIKCHVQQNKKTSSVVRWRNIVAQHLGVVSCFYTFITWGLCLKQEVLDCTICLLWRS